MNRAELLKYSVHIGRKPHIRKLEDRWGWNTPFLTTNSSCYMCLEEWKHIDAFQIGIPNTMPDAKEVDRYLMSKVRNDNPFEGEMSYELKMSVQIIEKLLKFSGGSTVWEFNGLAPNKKCWVRNIVVFGDKTDPMRIWTWKDVVASFFFKVWVKIYNLIRGWCLGSSLHFIRR